MTSRESTQPADESGRTVIVPLRSFSSAKSRLGDVLDADQRSRLARTCAERVLTCAGIERSLVVCNDAEVAAWSENLGAASLVVDAEGLNRSLEAAVARIGVHQLVGDIVVVHADLAFAEALTDLDDIVPPNTENSVTIVPDRHRDGTNVLALGGGVLRKWRFAYGRDSFGAHRRAALTLGAELRIVEHDDLGFDLDTPEDLEHHRVHQVVQRMIPGWEPPRRPVSHDIEAR